MIIATMSSIAEIIKSDCAGNVYESDREFSPMMIEKLVQKVKCQFGVGIREPGMWVMLSVPLLSHQCIEITRIEVDKVKRGTGVFRRFVERLFIVCRKMNRSLVIGCVESERMMELMRKHKQIWHRFSSDPTSFVYVPPY
jgi:hypothetical protein